MKIMNILQSLLLFQPYDGAEKRPIWFLFSGMGSQWTRMGVDLLRLPTFAKAIRLCHDILLPKGVNLFEILYSDDPNVYASSILHSFVGIAAIQVYTYIYFFYTLLFN